MGANQLSKGAFSPHGGIIQWGGSGGTVHMGGGQFGNYDMIYQLVHAH